MRQNITGRDTPRNLFRDKLLGITSNPTMKDTKDWISDDDEPLIEDELDSECPSIRRPWKQTMIVKLLGRSIGFNLLLKKIKELWRPTTTIELVALDNRFFMVKFTAREDYEFAKFGGPWMIFTHYLTIQPWKQNFDPNTGYPSEPLGLGSHPMPPY